MKITTKDYYWECGAPGCCTEYGTILYIDDKEVDDRRFMNVEDAYRYVLEELLHHEVDTIYYENTD